MQQFEHRWFANADRDSTGRSSCQSWLQGSCRLKVQTFINTVAIMRVTIPSNCCNRPQSTLNEVHRISDVFWMRLIESCFVELPLIEPCGINVQRFFVDFSWIETGGQHGGASICPPRFAGRISRLKFNNPSIRSMIASSSPSQFLRFAAWNRGWAYP